MKRRYRYAIDGVVIVLVVAVALTVITIISARRLQENPPPLANAGAEADNEVNENFSVETDQKNNVPLAGKHPGADCPSSTALAATTSPMTPACSRAGRKADRGCSGRHADWGLDTRTSPWWTESFTPWGTKAIAKPSSLWTAAPGKRSGARRSPGRRTRSRRRVHAAVPAVAGGIVCSLGGGGDLVCLDAGSGKIRWQKNILSDFGGDVPVYGICESVLMDQDRVICTPGGQKATMVAFDAKTGKVLWPVLTPDNDRAGYASPAFAEVGGMRQYIQLTAKGTIGVTTADDGRFLWRNNSAANGNANCSSPLAAGNLVFSASGYGTGGSLVKLSDNQCIEDSGRFRPSSQRQ